MKIKDTISSSILFIVEILSTESRESTTQNSNFPNPSVLTRHLSQPYQLQIPMRRCSQSAQLPRSFLIMPVHFNPMTDQMGNPLYQNQIPIQSNQMVNPLYQNQIPIQSNQIPIQSNQMPIQSYQIPIQSYQIPIQSNQIPIQSNQIPIQLQVFPKMNSHVNKRLKDSNYYYQYARYYNPDYENNVFSFESFNFSENTDEPDTNKISTELLKNNANFYSRKPTESNFKEYKLFD